MVASSYLQEYATRAAGAVGNGLEASITVREHGLTVLAASSAPAAQRCDQAEARADDGPCIVAADRGGVEIVASVAEEARWEHWRAQTRREGFATVGAFPAEAGPDTVITLNLYSRTPQDWSGDLLGTADACARLIAAGVRLHLQFVDLEDAAAGLYRTMTDAVAVEQALGAIMAQNDCSRDKAVELLRSAAERREVSERVVAESILRSLASDGRGDIVDESEA
jgi:hypothetical protein